jgi:hypothetical protein
LIELIVAALVLHGRVVHGNATLRERSAIDLPNLRITRCNRYCRG